MIKKLVYEYYPMSVDIADEIDREIILKMIDVLGEDSSYIEDAILNIENRNYTQHLIGQIAIQTPHKILSVEVHSEICSQSYEIFFDDMISATIAENIATVELEFIANNI